MNQGPDFQPRADDEADRDPLLGALRQRLGEGFGQEPPPELWASIRQQLPVAAPRPWWLRSRRLLALLLLVGGVLLSGLAVWLAGPKPAATRLAHQPITQPAAISTSVPNATSAGSLTTAPGTAPRVGSNLPVATPGSLGRPQASPASQTTSASPAAPTATTSGQELAATQPPRAVPSATLPALHEATRSSLMASSTKRRTAAAIMRGTERALPSSVANHHRPKQAKEVNKTVSASNQPAVSGLASAVDTKSTNSSPAGADATSAAINQVTVKQESTSAPATTSITARRGRRTPRLATRASVSQPADMAASSALAATTHPARRAKRRLVAPRVAIGQAPPLATGYSTNAALVPPVALDSLAGRNTNLALTKLALPAPLAARPDSAGPWLPPVRRWSVLALVGPTISYRTTQQAFSPALSYSPTPTNSATFSGRGSSSASLVDLERPAAGLGAQVQVRRVLTGRWALALGVGYQEYATRLMGQVTLTRSVYNATRPDSTLTLNQRETYRFFTLPVQLSYALGPPRGRLSLGVLGGLEPSWYQGGSATVLSGSNARNLSFSSAAGSPYNSFNLAVSLGVDARLRLGGPATRWQLVVQPTARYLVTPFVRGNTLDYTSRQPYSLGILTGLAWQLP
jgi:hypothetical protein